MHDTAVKIIQETNVEELLPHDDYQPESLNPPVEPSTPYEHFLQVLSDGLFDPKHHEKTDTVMTTKQIEIIWENLSPTER